MLYLNILTCASKDFRHVCIFNLSIILKIKIVKDSIILLPLLFINCTNKKSMHLFY